MKKLAVVLLFSFTGLISSAQTDILLRNYKPRSIYNIPITEVKKAKYPVIDMHSHAYPETEQELENWVEVKKKAGIEKTVVLSGLTGKEFDSIIKLYAKYGEMFDLWCGLDFSSYGKPDFEKNVLAELERCKKKGAKGVGELTDKGLGVYVAFQNNRLNDIHLDDPIMDRIFAKCAELQLPLNVHVAEPYWMFLPADEHNDGMMNAANWEIDLSVPGQLTHENQMSHFENAVKKNPKTTFIACHFMNCCYDLTIPGKMLDKYPNLYLDISARLAETGSIPRYVNKFITKYANRIFYGTDNGTDYDMYTTSFRFLETDDEHFYVSSFGYQWNLSGFKLSDAVLRKLYSKNAEKIYLK